MTFFFVMQINDTMTFVISPLPPYFGNLIESFQRMVTDLVIGTL